MTDREELEHIFGGEFKASKIMATLMASAVLSWLVKHDFEVSRENWGEAAKIARTYDDGTDVTVVSIVEEFEAYAQASEMPQRAPISADAGQGEDRD